MIKETILVIPVAHGIARAVGGEPIKRVISETVAFEGSVAILAALTINIFEMEIQARREDRVRREVILLGPFKG